MVRRGNAFRIDCCLVSRLDGTGTNGDGSTFQVVATPNENFNSELFAASASSPNDIWAVGQLTIHFDGARGRHFPPR